MLDFDKSRTYVLISQVNPPPLKQKQKPKPSKVFILKVSYSEKVRKRKSNTEW